MIYLFYNLLLKVKLKFPSKTVYKEITEEANASIGRNVVCGTNSSIVNAMWSSEELKSCVLSNVEKEIQSECSKLCSRKSPSILTYISPDSLVSLKDSQIVYELEERAPTLHRCLAAAASSNSKQRQLQDPSQQQLRQKITSTLSMASSVLLRCRNPAMSANAHRLSVLLWHGGAQKQVKLQYMHLEVLW